MTQANNRQHRPIADLQTGEHLDDEVYLVAQKDLRTASNGSLYIHAVLADQSGQMVARMWNATQALYESLAESNLIHVRGRVDSYKGRPQIIIDGLRTVEPGSVDPSDFLPTTRHDVEGMWARVLEILRTVENPHLRPLIAGFVNDEELAQGFKRAPAARTLHHAFLGGLLEHTLNVLELAALVMPRYPEISRDLVLTGVFLHDIGKVRELSYEAGFEYTDEGQLIGHIVQATIWIHDAARRVEDESGQPFPADLLAALKHIIVSHHGKYEFGSPKLPATPEAILIHYLDNLDAKLAMMLHAIESDPDQSSHWTPWVPALETRVFKPDVTGTETPKTAQ